MNIEKEGNLNILLIVRVLNSSKALKNSFFRTLEVGIIQ